MSVKAQVKAPALAGALSLMFLANAIGIVFRIVGTTQYGQWIHIAGDVLIDGYVGMLAVWLGFGGWPLSLRLLLCGIGIAALKISCTASADHFAITESAVYTLYVIVTALPSIVLRLSGYRVVSRAQEGTLPCTLRDCSIFQFTLAELVDLTSGIGLLAIIWRVAASGPTQIWDHAGINSTVLDGPIACSIGWAMLSRTRVFSRLAAVLVGSVVLCMVLSGIGIIFFPMDQILMWIVLYCFATMVSFSLFRMLGYRLIHCPGLSHALTDMQ